MSPNTTTVTVFAPSKTNVVFNSVNPLACRVPAFFIAVSSWATQAERTVLIGGSSGQYEYVGEYAQLHVMATCSPGSFINVGGALLGNVTAFYEFLVPLASSALLCSRCNSGTFSTPDTMTLCPNCSAGTFANSNNTECLSCTAGMWSRSGTQGTCAACSSNATTRERDHCVTLSFLGPPPPTIVSGVPNKIPVVALVDVYDSVVVPRSGTVSIQLQCKLPGCQTDSNAEFDLITLSLSVVNGSSAAADISFVESSQIKVGTGFVWRIFTSQEPGTLASSNINSQQSLHPVMFLGGAASISSVSPTQVASVGGTAVRVTSIWKLTPRISSIFVNDSAFCVFQFISSGASSNATNVTVTNSPSSTGIRQERIRAIDSSDETVKICVSPSIPEFSRANLTIILQDGRRSASLFSLESVCHNSFYVNGSKCQQCPVSSTGRSSNALINALSPELCVCSAGSYGTFGEFCRFCPTPSSLPSPPFICNSSNLQYPVVAPGYWVDYSLLPRCDAVSTVCSAVTTCAFGARACPGGGEKLCTQQDDECYEGKGCSSCCPMYYNENNACFKCPDSSQTTALLAVVAVVCFILAVLMSSVSSPSFTQSSKHRSNFDIAATIRSFYVSLPHFAVKYFVISSNFLQKMFSVKVGGVIALFLMYFSMRAVHLNS